MQIILFMLGLFTIGCVLYGIAAGVQVIVRGFTHLAGNAKGSAPDAGPSATPPSPAMPKTTNASPLQRSIDELRALFTLYQQGALTQAEFENMKQCLLGGIKVAAARGH